MASTGHHHYSSMDKKLKSHKRSPSSSSSSSTSTSSSTSSSSSTSDSSSSRRQPGGGTHRRDGKHKSRSRKRQSSSNDRSKVKMKKSSSSSRKHSNSKTGRTSSHSRPKDYDKIGRSHKTGARSPSYHKSSSRSKKKSSSSTSHKTSKGSLQLPIGGSERKSTKSSPSSSKIVKGRKRSISPRDRFDYRGDKMAVNERSLSHSRDSSIPGSSSRVPRDPRTDDRLRRGLSPTDSLGRDRYRGESPSRRYEKERMDDFIDRRERRVSPSTRGRDIERKELHRHKEYEKHEREPYDDRKREDVRRDDRDRERDTMRDRDLVKDRILVDREAERERLREPTDRKASRYGRPDDYGREREMMVKGQEFESEREYYSRRSEMEGLGGTLDDRHQYDQHYDRYLGDRERGRYDPGGRGRYEDIPPQHRGGAYSPIDDRRLEERRSRPSNDPIESRPGPEERRRLSGGPPHHEWGDEHRPSGGPPGERGEVHYGMHRHHHQPEWVPGGGPPPRIPPPHMWDRHKHPRHDEWGEEGYSHSSEWMDNIRDWADGGAPPPPHDDMWPPPLRRGYRDDWGGRGDWGPPDRPPPTGPPRLPPPKEKIMVAPPPVRRPKPEEHPPPKPLPVVEDVKEAPKAKIEPTPTPSTPAKRLSSETTESIGASIKKLRPDPSPTPKAFPPPPLKEDNFSDFSDDSDDILNQEVSYPEEEPARNTSTTSATPAEDFKLPPPVLDKEPTYEELMDDVDLEEISDDDLEDEKQAKFSVADVLDINWSSLMDTKPPPTTEVPEGSALKRFRSINLLSRLGISTKYARQEVIKDVVEKCTVAANEENIEKDEEIPIVPPVCDNNGVVRILKSQAEMRRQRMLNIGSNRRALCARQDLALRHLYCNLPERDLGEAQYFDKELFSQAAASMLTTC